MNEIPKSAGFFNRVGTIANEYAKGKNYLTKDSESAKASVMKHFPTPIYPQKGSVELHTANKIANGLFLGFCILCPPFVAGHAITSVVLHSLNKPQNSGVEVEKKGFAFGTWNAGSNRHDYQISLIHGPGKIIPESLNKDEAEAMYAEYDKLTGAARERLLPKAAEKLAARVDVCALQEITSYERADIKEFEKQGFEVHGNKDKNPDSLIAINPKKFKDIENRSFKIESDSYAVVVATEKATGKRIAFVSGHFPGFNLEADAKTRKEGAAVGDLHVYSLVQYLNSECRDCDTLLVGADMNATPEIHKNRFDKFTVKDFETLRTNRPTERYNNSEKMPLRELDYVFLKSYSNSFLSFIRNLFNRETVHVAHVRTGPDEMRLDFMTNPSDHAAVVVDVRTRNATAVVASNAMKSLKEFFNELHR